MGQTVTYTIDGGASKPFREHEEIEIEVLFGTENSANITLDQVSYVDSDLGPMNTLLKQKWLTNPFEGAEVGIKVADGADSFQFDFFADWRKLVFQSDVELKVALNNIPGLSSFDDKAKAVTFARLELENFLNLNDYQNCPYVVENRKTRLEKIQLLAQGWAVLKAIGDEIHKIINIASDLPTLGIAQAAINLIVTTAALVLLIQRLVQLFNDIVEAFFPPVLYHSGIKPKVFIQKAAELLGFDSVEFGNFNDFGEVMEAETWLGSKYDEKGILVDIINPTSGALKPGDKGYNLFDMIEILTDKYTVQKGIVNNVLHLRPAGDPFWTSSPSYTMPDVLIEQALEVNNGTWEPNYNEFFNSTILEFATDDSDRWTIQDRAEDGDPTTGGKTISGVVVTQTTAVDPKKAITQQGKLIQVPQAVCVRKDIIDELLDIFIGTASELDIFKEQVTLKFEQFAATLGTLSPVLESFVLNVGGRTGVLKVENHFFSTPKVLFLKDTDIGISLGPSSVVPRIPANFADFIGAKACITKYHNYNSFVPGVRNPTDQNDTAAKFIYKEVRIPFNVKSLSLILNNPYFSIQGGGTGKFTAFKWNNTKDKVTVSFWVPENWAQNIEETLIQT